LSFGARVDLLAGGEQLADVAVHRQVEMRNGLYGCRQALGDGASHAVMRHDVVAARFEQREDLLVRHRWRDRRRSGRRRRGRSLQALAGFRLRDVAGDDAAMRAGTGDARKLDAGLLGEAAGQR
jgi:hypothetical protein